MNPITISLIVFACVFGGTVAGIFIRARMPEGYLSSDAKDVIKLALGVIATMNALVLGLLISTAKSSYDLKRAQLTQISGDAILIDRTLALYGSETNEARSELRDLVKNLVEQLESFRGDRAKRGSPEVKAGAKQFYQSVRALKPRDDAQKSLKDEAVRVSLEVAQIRALALARQSSSIPAPFLVILAFWLTVLFMGFGLCAPSDSATVIVLAVCAFSVSIAIFLILQMDQPFTGLMRVSIEPLRKALDVLGQ